MTETLRLFSSLEKVFPNNNWKYYEKENTPVYTASPLFDDIVFISRELQTIGSFVSPIFEPGPSSPWKYYVQHGIWFGNYLKMKRPANNILGGFYLLVQKFGWYFQSRHIPAARLLSIGVRIFLGPSTLEASIHPVW